jgi:two-component system chemotaxis response regulator CheY
MKILVVDDEPVTRRILENLLNKWGYETVSAVHGADAWELIQKPPHPNLVLSDWMMPNLDGVELCKRIRRIDQTGYNYIYFILLTTKTDKRDLITGLESGADDFIVKPFDQEELRSRVKIGERIVNLEQKIITLANTDYLTGVMNRRAFMDRFESEANRCIRNGRSLSIILMDIDHFKSVNDCHGHQTGDRVLKRFAAVISGYSRTYDIVGRYGGEEFIVCLPETDLDAAVNIAERMRENVEALDVGSADNPREVFKVTASFGVVTGMLKKIHEAESLINRADAALYRAKENGRNRVEKSDWVSDGGEDEKACRAGG